MKRTLILTLVAAGIALAAASIALAQPETLGHIRPDSVLPSEPNSLVRGAPYSATIVNESIQTLADGNRIVQRSTGATTRDSEGRTRQDVVVPQMIGNMSSGDVPHLVFIHDPIAHASYTLNLTDKTANKLPEIVADQPPTRAGLNLTVGPSVKMMIGAGMSGPSVHVITGTAIGGGTISGAAATTTTAQTAQFAQKQLAENAATQTRTENLGTATMQGVSVEGVRTTRIIAAGEIGNDRPIEIVNEVWTSPELKTIVSSKRSDPRMGDQTFQLTNIVRSDPDPSLFTVPPDFKLLEGGDAKGNVILYRPND